MAILPSQLFCSSFEFIKFQDRSSNPLVPWMRDYYSYPRIILLPVLQFMRCFSVNIPAIYSISILLYKIFLKMNNKKTNSFFPSQLNGLFPFLGVDLILGHKMNVCGTFLLRPVPLGLKISILSLRHEKVKRFFSFFSFFFFWHTQKKSNI